MESAPDAGTVFHICFPYAKEEGAKDKAKDKNKDKGTLPASLGTVLVVDDDESFLRVTARILSSSGHTVLKATGGAEALKMLQERGKPVDLLLTDVVMPEMNGRQLAAEVAKRGLAAKTLFMSGYTDEIITHHGIPETGLALISKPFSHDELKKKLREVLDSPADQAKA